MYGTLYPRSTTIPFHIVLTLFHFTSFIFCLSFPFFDYILYLSLISTYTFSLSFSLYPLTSCFPLTPPFTFSPPPTFLVPFLISSLIFHFFPLTNMSSSCFLNPLLHSAFFTASISLPSLYPPLQSHPHTFSFLLPTFISAPPYLTFYFF